jgi:hypothetical protein
MPDYFAHTVFGEAVLARLPAPQQAQLREGETAFRCGLYGPDPMFFLFGRARDEARRMHREPAAIPIARLTEAARTGEPEAVGYLAGFLCHFWLDHTCHPIVVQTAAKGELNHTAVETEFDRALLAQYGHDPSRETPLVPPGLPRAVCQAASRAYEQTSPGHYDRAYRAFWLVCRALTHTQGTAWRGVINGVSRLPGLHPLRGCISGKSPDPRAAESSAALGKRLSAEIEPAAQFLADYLAALPTNQHPESASVLQHDFFGK